ncbi:zinc-binding dehydrogenase [Streptomyces sp. NPDC060006]|uniref:zinc-binding dehydrogenase n=1 Tax=unclassified Streptomyces TaxID=2593676 RepID=UPI0036C96B1B
MGRHQARTDLGREFGRHRCRLRTWRRRHRPSADLTGGHGTLVVLECVGNMPAYEQATGIVRPGGVISRVGVPQYGEVPIGFGSLFRHNIRLGARTGAGPRAQLRQGRPRRCKLWAAPLGSSSRLRVPPVMLQA